MAEKFCIFCGQKPENKNMEHVIPQWLIRLTGREKKDVFENFPASHKHLTFMQYKFPACEKCNSEYSDLESQVRSIMINVLDDKPISGTEASLLLDWFDKVRVGIWLAEMCYDPELKRQVHPNFYINSRVGKFDRMLSIQKIQIMPAGAKGIYFTGQKSPLFHYFPSVFGMLINDHYFTNISTVDLVAPRLGFHHLCKPQMVNPFKPELLCSLEPGRHRIINPVIKQFIPNKESITFYQPILKDETGKSFMAYDEYAMKHCYDIDAGLGGVFVQKGNIGNTHYMEKDDKVGTRLKPVPAFDYSINVLKLQRDIYEKTIGKTGEANRQAATTDMIIKLYEQGRFHLF